MLSEKDQQQIEEIFGTLKRKVHLRVYVQKLDCETCTETEQIMGELEELSDLLEVEMLNPQVDTGRAEADGVEMVPAIIVSDGTHGRPRFYGTPSGYEFSSLLTAIVDMGMESPPVEEQTAEFLEGLEQDLDMKVFVTPSCPYCPRAAVLGLRLAMASPRVTTRVIEANEFPDLSRRYSVQGVPRTVVNDRLYAEGLLPEGPFVAALSEGLGREGEIDIVSLAREE
jgi:glutaredoxin-like protein